MFFLISINCLKKELAVIWNVFVSVYYVNQMTFVRQYDKDGTSLRFLERKGKQKLISNYHWSVNLSKAISNMIKGKWKIMGMLKNILMYFNGKKSKNKKGCSHYFLGAAMITAPHFFVNCLNYEMHIFTWRCFMSAIIL